MQESSPTFATRKADFAQGNYVNNDAFNVERIHKFEGKTLHVQHMPRKYLHETSSIENLTMGPKGRPPLANISNEASDGIPIQVHFFGEKRRQRRTSSISPYKRSGSSRSSILLHKNTTLINTGQSPSLAKGCWQMLNVSTHYPPQQKIKTVEIFEGPPDLNHSLEHLNLGKAMTYNSRYHLTVRGSVHMSFNIYRFSLVLHH